MYPVVGLRVLRPLRLSRELEHLLLDGPEARFTVLASGSSLDDGGRDAKNDDDEDREMMAGDVDAIAHR